MPRRAAPVCFLYFTEGLRLTFSLLCGIVGPATTHSSDRPLIQLQGPDLQTTKTDTGTNLVGEKKGQKTENGSGAKKEEDSGGCCCVIL